MFIDEIHTILRAGAVEGGALDAGNILKPALARGDMRCAEHHHVIIADDALEAAVQLSVAWLPGRRLPDKALDLLDEACSHVRVPSIVVPGDAGLVVTSQTVARVLAEWVNVSVDEPVDL